MTNWCKTEKTKYLSIHNTTPSICINSIHYSDSYHNHQSSIHIKVKNASIISKEHAFTTQKDVRRHTCKTNLRPLVKQTKIV